MLITVAALPLLLAATLDAPAAAHPRLGAEPRAAEPLRAHEAPPRSIESSPRAPEPALRRTWSAVGCRVAQVAAPAVQRAMAAPGAASAVAKVEAYRLRTRGPPVAIRVRFPISLVVAGRG
jgi:hypothetical protein